MDGQKLAEKDANLINFWHILLMQLRSHGNNHHTTIASKLIHFSQGDFL
jgi:hypothetical protein